MLGDRPGETAVGQLLRRRRALGDDLQRALDQRIVARLDQHPAGDRFHLQPRACRIGEVAGQQQAQILLLGEYRLGRLGRIGRADDFGKDVADRRRSLLVERAVECDDPAECGYRIARQRRRIGIEDRVGARHAAGIGVLHDHAGRWPVAELGEQFERSIGVVQIVVAQFLALHLACLGDAARGRADRQVKRCRLVGILPVAKRIGAPQRHRQRVRKRLALIGEGEPRRNRRVIGGGGGIGLGREPLAVVERRRAAIDQRIIGRIGDDRDIGVVLGRRSHHRRAADIDILDDLVARSALRDGLGERIEIDHHQIDRADLMLLHRCGVRGIVAHREQAAVNLGVQRLDAAVHHLGKPRQVRNVAHRQPGVAQRLGGAPGRNQLHAPGGERLAEIDDAGLVGNR